MRPKAQKAIHIRPEDPRGDVFSKSTFQFITLFGQEALKNFSLFTATRLSATFPYFMPISSIFTPERRRAVDAGYYDNYGVSLATRWLEWTLKDPQRRKWLSKSVSNILVIQIRDTVPPLTQNHTSQGDKSNSGTGIWGRLAQASENLTGPLLALFQYRESSQLFNNDEQLAEVLNGFNSEFNDKHFASTILFQLEHSASLSWTLSEKELQDIKNATQTSDFLEQLDAVEELLATKPSKQEQIEMHPCLTGSATESPAENIVEQIIPDITNTAIDKTKG